MNKYLSALTLFVVILITGCAKQKGKEEFTFEELHATAQSELKKKQYQAAAETLETIVSRFSDRPNIGKYKLALAQLYFKEGRYPSSFELYDHYSQFYPGDNNAETAKYRAVLSKFNQTLRDDCDQTTTKEAVKLCDEYLQNYPNAKHTGQVQDIQYTCNKKLINKEIYIFDFYFKRGKYQAANKRLLCLEKEFLTKDKSLEAELLYMKCKLAQKTKKLDIFQENINKLETAYPETRYAHMAKALTNPSPVNFLF